MQFQLSSKKLYKPFSNDLENPNIKFFVKKILGEDKGFFLTAIVYAVAIAILSLATPISVQLLINSVAFTAMLQPILILGLILFLLLSFSAVLNVLQFYVSEIFQRKFFARMSADITLSTINARHENFEESNQTEFVNRFFDVITIQKTLPKILIKSFTLILQTIAGLILVAFYHPILLIFSLLIIISIIIIWRSFCKKGFVTKFYSSRRKYDMAGWLEDIARNNILFKSEIGQKYAIFKTDFLTEQYLKERKLDLLIKNLEQPVLGICLGMQLMCTHSTENNTPCLGIFEEQVKQFKPLDPTIKVPQIGWNTISNLKSILFEGIPENSYAYFVHGYYAALGAHTIATTNYVEEYSSALQKNNFYGVQFHPEKSAIIGEQIIKNFLSL